MHIGNLFHDKFCYCLVGMLVVYLVEGRVNDKIVILICSTFGSHEWKTKRIETYLYSTVLLSFPLSKLKVKSEK